MAISYTGYVANSNVNFIRTTQAALNTELAKAASSQSWTQGAFYLTVDTDRLYFAQTANELVPLNQFIRMWASSNTNPPTLSNTPALSAGDIYYWEDPKNILMICDDPSTNSWTQLNPDTFLKNSTSGLSVSGSTEGQRTINLTVQDTKDGSSAVHSVTGSVTLAAGNNVGITSSGDTITISATDTNDNTTYALSAAQGTGNASNSAVVTLTGTPHALGVAGTAAAETLSLVGGDNVTVSYAAGSGDNKGSITIAGQKGVTAVSQSFSSTGQLLTDLTMNDSTHVQTAANSTFIPKIKYGATYGSATNAAADQTSVFFDGNDSDTATLNVYTKDQIDSIIQTEFAAADALVYKGAISSSNAMSKIGVAGSSSGTYAGSVGDTYKASEDLDPTHPSGCPVTAKAGDLIIATGTDGAVTWEVIPSGDDQLISVDASQSKEFIIKDNSVSIGSLAIDGSTNTYGTISVTDSTAGNAKSLTIAHGAAGTAQTKLGSVTSGTAYTSVVTTSGTGCTELQTPTAPTGTQAQHDAGVGASIDIPTITGISYDAAGHITEVSTKTFRVWDTHGKVTSTLAASSVANSNVATITQTLTVDGITASQPSVNIKAKDTSGSVSVDVASGDVVIGLVWQEF